MKRTLSIAVFLACMTTLAFFVGCADTSPLRIGFVGTMVGKLSDLGVPGRNGAQLALETVNARGGIAGRMLELVVEDDGNSPEQAKQAVERLAREGVVGIIGHMTSQMSLAGYPVAERLGIPMVSPTAATPELSGKKDLFFRVLPVSTKWSEGLAKHALKQGRRRAFMVWDQSNESYCVPVVRSFEDVFRTGGGAIVGEYGYSGNDFRDWSGLASKIAASSADSVVVAMSARDLAQLARARDSLELAVPIYSAMWAYTKEILLAGGNAVNGITFAVGYVDDMSSRAFQEFRSRFMQRFGWEPNYAAALSYEATMLLLAGLEDTGGRREGLAEALVGLRGMQGVIGDYVLDEYGDVVRSSFLVTITDRRFEIVDIIKD